MSKMVQIRNMPDDLHRKLKVRAAQQGVSLSDLLLRMAEREANQLTVDELTARIRARSRPEALESAADVVRGLRDEAD
jgi:plasmid stability protein